MRITPSTWPGTWLASTLLTGALLVWTELEPARPDEPLVLRWARVAAQHPFRTSLALALLLAAFGPLRTTRADPEHRSGAPGLVEGRVPR